MTALTLADVDRALPPQFKGGLNQEIVDTLNSVITDPIMAENMIQNMVNYTKVLSEGKFKLEDYVNAVMYVSFKLMGYTDRESYQRTFPTRYGDLVLKGTPTKDIASYVSAYNKGKLVNLIYEQTMIPTYVLNQHVFQQAINHQQHLMLNAKSEMVQQRAAESLMTILNKPVETKVKLDIGFRESEEINDLRESMRKLTESQQKMISNGATTQSIAHQVLIEREAVDVTPR